MTNERCRQGTPGRRFEKRVFRKAFLRVDQGLPKFIDILGRDLWRSHETERIVARLRNGCRQRQYWRTLLWQVDLGL